MSDKQLVNTPENWNAASKGYAEKVAPYMMEKYAEDFIQRLDVNSNMEAIEVACGSGALTAELSKNVKSLLATDFAAEMLDKAKAKINTAGLKNVSFSIMDGQALEVEDNKMDRAACSFGLMLFPDRNKGFKELNRVLRPDGKAMVSGWAGPDKFEGFGLFMGAIMRAFPNFPKPASPPPVFSLADLNSFKNEMEDAGFKNVNVEYVDKELIVNTFEELWAMMTVGAPPVKLLFDQVGSEGKDKVRDALAEIVNARFGSGPIIVNNSATVGVGTAT